MEESKAGIHCSAFTVGIKVPLASRACLCHPAALSHLDSSTGHNLLCHSHSSVWVLQCSPGGSLEPQMSVPFVSGWASGLTVLLLGAFRENLI